MVIVVNMVSLSGPDWPGSRAYGCRAGGACQYGPAGINRSAAGPDAGIRQGRGRESCGAAGRERTEPQVGCSAAGALSAVGARSAGVLSAGVRADLGLPLGPVRDDLLMA